MVYFPDSWTLCVITVTLIGLVTLFCWYQSHVFSYWKELGVPYIPVDSWLFGNIKKHTSKKCSWTQLVSEFYETFAEQGFGGIFILRKPALVICKQELIEKVLVEDFSHFHDRFTPIMVNDLFSNALSYATGEKWRIMRSKILPAFSSGKIKGMFDQILSCCNQSLSQFSGIGSDLDAVDIESITLSFSAEAIASCSFGIELLSNPKSKKGFERVLEIMSHPRQLMKINLTSMKPEFFKHVWSKVLDTEVSDYFIDTTKAAIEFREVNKIYRNDFLQLMIKLKKDEENYVEKEFSDNTKTGNSLTKTNKIFTEDFIASQMLSFTQAGSTPTRVTICLTLFELSKNPVIQQKVQAEIDSVISKHGEWSFEAVKDMVYLDQVIQETMRLHTYVPNLLRTVVEPYTLPGTDITLEKGTWIIIPVSAIHVHPQFYQNPKVFDPDRFVGNCYKPSARYMPFGHGPRICISIKYAVLIMKVFLAKVLSQYYVRISPKMKSPPTLDPTVVFPQFKGGVWLSLEKRLGSVQ